MSGDRIGGSPARVGGVGRVTGAQQYRLTVDLVNKGIKNREIRLPAPRRRE